MTNASGCPGMAKVGGGAFSSKGSASCVYLTSEVGIGPAEYAQVRQTAAYSQTIRDRLLHEQGVFRPRTRGREQSEGRDGRTRWWLVARIRHSKLEEEK